MSKNSTKIGTYGEIRVAGLLPGAEHSNFLNESRLPYDILWEDIKIDVKTTAQTVNSKSCSFNVTLAERNNGVVMVFVALLEDREYFWVDKAHSGLKGYFRLADAISADELPNKVKEVNKKSYKDMDNIAKGHAMIRVKADNFKRIQSARFGIIRERDEMITLENTVMEGIKLLERKVNK